MTIPDSTSRAAGDLFSSGLEGTVAVLDEEPATGTSKRDYSIVDRLENGIRNLVRRNKIIIPPEDYYGPFSIFYSTPETRALDRMFGLDGNEVPSEDPRFSSMLQNASYIENTVARHAAQVLIGLAKETGHMYGVIADELLNPGVIGTPRPWDSSLNLDNLLEQKEGPRFIRERLYGKDVVFLTGLQNYSN